MFRRYRQHLSVLSIALILLYALPWGAQAATRTWDGGHATTGAWAEATNWSDDTAPAAGDTAVFDGTSADPCTLLANVNIGRLSVTSGYSGIISFGASVDTFSAGVSLAGTDTMYLKTSNIYVSGGDWKCSGKISPGTSALKFTGTATQVFKCTQLYYDIQVNKASGIFVDSSGIRTATGGDLTVTDAGTSIRHVGSPVFGGDALYNGADTVFGPTSGSWTMNGASSTLHMQSTGVWSNVSGDSLIFNGTTGCVFDNDKAGTFKHLAFGAGAKLTSSGAATTIFSTTTSGHRVASFGGNTKYTQNVAGIFQIANSSWFLQGATDTINGTGQITFSNGLTAALDTLTNYTYTGSGTQVMSTTSASNTNVHIVLVGTINLGTASLSPRWGNSSGANYFDADSTTITCGALSIGTSNAAGTGVFDFTGATVSASSFTSNDFPAGVCSLYTPRTMTCGGNWLGTTQLFPVPGTSKVTFNNTAAATITSNGKQFADTIVINPSAGKRVTLADNLIAGVLRHISGVFAMGGKNVTLTGRLACTTGADSLLGRIATCTLTTGTNAQDTLSASSWVQLDSCVWRVSGQTGINYSSANTATLRKLSQTNSTDRTTLNGSGSWTWLTAPWAGDLTVAKSAGTITVGTMRVDSLSLTGGTLAITNHSGADSVRMALSHTGGTLNTSGDTVYLGGPATWGAGATHTTDAATLYYEADGSTITTAGKAMPRINALGSITLNGGGTVARLTMTANGKTATFGNGTWTFAALDSSDLNGASGSLNTYTGGTWDIPAAIVASYVSASNCSTATGDTIYADNGTNTNGGGTVGWYWGGAVTAAIRTWLRDFDSWRSATFGRADYQFGTHSRRPYR